MQRQTRAIVLLQLSPWTLLNLNYIHLRLDKAQSTKVFNGSRLFKQFCLRKQLHVTDWGCSPFGSLNSSCSPCSPLPPHVQAQMKTCIGHGSPNFNAIFLMILWPFLSILFYHWNLFSRIRNYDFGCNSVWRNQVDNVVLKHNYCNVHVLL